MPLVKSLLLCYWGWRAYRRGVPLFLGLILGEFIVGSIWGLIGGVLRRPTYVFWPY